MWGTLLIPARGKEETGSDKMGWRQDDGKERGRKDLAAAAPSSLIFQVFTLMSDSWFLLIILIRVTLQKTAL